jgi:hypothetical protein
MAVDNPWTTMSEWEVKECQLWSHVRAWQTTMLSLRV